MKQKRSIMQIASVPEEEWTDEERIRITEYNSKLDDLLLSLEGITEE